MTKSENYDVPGLKLFVYGTLKTGERNWKRFFAPTRGKPAVVLAHRLHDRNGVAVMVPTGNARHRVYGEVFDVDLQQLRRIDMHEGVGAEVYDRHAVTTTDGERCWAYVNARLGHLPVIRGGTWHPPVCPVCDEEYVRRIDGWMGELYVHTSVLRAPEDWCVVLAESDVSDDDEEETDA